MNGCIRSAKWLIVPLSILITQVSLGARGAFRSEPAVCTFIATSLVALLIWRYRLGKLILRLTQREIPKLEHAGQSDRRFAFLSLSFPFALLFALQLTILVLVVSDIAWVHRHSGTLWTVFGISAVAFWQTAMGINLLIVAGSSRWQRILSASNGNPETKEC